jgi:CRISPR-associated protein (TIGR03984 family)
MTQAHTHQKRSNVTLYVFHWTAPPASLADVLADLAAQMDDGTVLAYSRERCLIGRVTAGQILDADGRDWSSDPTIFEARVFNEILELRWHSDPLRGSTGNSVVLTETSTPPGSRWALLEKLSDLSACDNSYLLWGKAANGATPDWTPLIDSRIGGITVPLAALQPDGRAELATVEYIGVGPLPNQLHVHGNSAVIEERLCRLRAFTPPSSPAAADSEE